MGTNFPPWLLQQISTCCCACSQYSKLLALSTGNTCTQGIAFTIVGFCRRLCAGSRVRGVVAAAGERVAACPGC